MHEPARGLKSLRALSRYGRCLQLILLLVQLTFVNLIVVIRARQEYSYLGVRYLPMAHLPAILVFTAVFGRGAFILFLTGLRNLRQPLSLAISSVAEVRVRGLRVSE